MLLAESRRRPVVLLVEDAEWLDDQSREFIERMTRSVAAYPLAIIFTSRDRTSLGWLFGLAGVNIQTVALANLETQGLTELAEGILGGSVLPALVQLLLARTGGNPFFAEQLLRYLQDEALLVKEDGSWKPRPEALQTSRVPANVRHLFTVRLDGLAAGVRDVVQTAAVLGREFELNWLQAMLPDSQHLQEQLTVAEKAQVLTGLSRMQYIFRSVLLRDVAYDTAGPGASA